MKATKESILRQATLISILVQLSFCSFGQNTQKPDSVPSLTLEQCIAYGLKYQPALNQAAIYLSIARVNNHINLSGWLPQVNLSGNLLHYIQQPTSFVPNQADPGGPPIETHTGIANTFTPVLSASQTLLNPLLVYDAKIAPLNIKQAGQTIDSSKINVVVSISKSFYNLLLTLEQINILKEDTARLGRSVTDAFFQYKGGIVDETDYQQAVITLNNSKALLKQQTENVQPEYYALKQIMGYPPEKQFNVVFDTTQMIRQITFDTTLLLQYEKRIEYRELQTEKQLQHQLTVYGKLSFLPSVSAGYSYFYEYQGSTLSNLFTTPYPYSYVGLTFNFPIFTGLSRLENIHKSKLQEKILDWEDNSLKSHIYTEYSTAMANYKSNRYNLNILKDNQLRAERVYYIVSLQYKKGIIPYLNILVAESNLISAETGYLNALFQVLSSKIDLEKAIGVIPY